MTNEQPHKNQPFRLRTLSAMSKSQHNLNSFSRTNRTNKNKPIQNRKLKSSSSHQLVPETHQKILLGKLRSNSNYDVKIFKNRAPYQKFVKQLKIVLPTPKQKFYEFMQIPPFNRLQNHTQLIQYFLKSYEFFRNHPTQIIQQLSRKVRIAHFDQINDKLLVVVQTGECYLQNIQPMTRSVTQKLKNILKLYRAGQLITRNQINPDMIHCNQVQTKFIVLNQHDYNSIVANYVNNRREQYKKFLLGIPVFKMFPDKSFDKFTQSMSIHFLTKGEFLFFMGEEANNVYVVFNGRAVRKVTVQIDKVNKIPEKKYNKIVKILSRSYQHKIIFNSQDLIGISQLVQNIQTCKQTIQIQQNSVILSLDKSTVHQYLDEYIIDRLRKYNLKKYPQNYDELCKKYQKQKTELKNSQLRKIDALKKTIYTNQSFKKTLKIESIIKQYQQKIRKTDLENLLDSKIHKRTIQRE